MNMDYLLQDFTYIKFRKWIYDFNAFSLTHVVNNIKNTGYLTVWNPLLHIAISLFFFFFFSSNVKSLFSIQFYWNEHWIWNQQVWIQQSRFDTYYLSYLGQPAYNQIRSVAQSCPTLCDPMNRSTPGLPVHHQLPEFTETHVHQVSDAIQPSHPLSSPSPPAPNPSQNQGLFQWVNSSHEVAKVLEFQL